MSRRWLLVVVVFLAGVIAGAVACQDTPQAGAESRVSDFLQAGRSYGGLTPGTGILSFTVTQIINDSWILAHTEYGDVWLNVGELLFVQEEQG